MNWLILIVVLHHLLKIHLPHLIIGVICLTDKTLLTKETGFPGGKIKVLVILLQMGDLQGNHLEIIDLTQIDVKIRSKRVSLGSLLLREIE